LYSHLQILFNHPLFGSAFALNRNQLKIN